MRKRTIIKIGDVFEVSLDRGQVGYFQFIMKDLSLLNSDVIRVFKTKYDLKKAPALEDIVKGEIHFYTHVFIKVGMKLNIWQKVGSAILENDLKKPYFRSSNDYGNPEVKISHDWYIWTPNEDYIQVGRLNEEQAQYHLGTVFSPTEIPEMMNSGKSSYFYPSYK